MSRTFSTNCGSADNLNVSRRCDSYPNVCQMRAIVALDRPATWAKLRVVHCVAGVGGALERPGNHVNDPIVGRFARRPGPWLVCQARETPGTKRSRHLQTLLLDTWSRLATARLVSPSAQANTIRDRSASRCAVIGRRVHCSSVRRSSSVSNNWFVVAFSRHAAQRTWATAEVQDFF